MSMKWSELSEEARAEIGRDLDAALTADLLSEPAAPAAAEASYSAVDEVAPRVRFHDLYAALNGPESRMPPRIARGLLVDRRLRADFDALVRATALTTAPAAAAAAGVGQLDGREEADFSLRLTPSRADGTQIYVTLRPKTAFDRPPGFLLAMPADGAPIKAALPEEIDGVYQLLLEEGDPLISALRDPKTEIAIG